jgi:DNA-directed RNA polymerase subunit M/transcription elongation factor TFIIS
MPVPASVLLAATLSAAMLPAERQHRSTAKRSRSRRNAAASRHEHEPLGSLTQPGARGGAGCEVCGSERVTRISMELADGSPVHFTSCHRCEHRAWTGAGDEGDRPVLPVESVLDRARTRR